MRLRFGLGLPGLYLFSLPKKCILKFCPKKRKCYDEKRLCKLLLENIKNAEIVLKQRKKGIFMIFS